MDFCVVFDAAVDCIWDIGERNVGPQSVSSDLITECSFCAAIIL